MKNAVAMILCFGLIMTVGIALATEIPLLEITEVMTNNDTVWQLDFEDYVELHNAGKEDILLSNYFLSRTNENIFQCRLPAKTLASGEYMIFRCGDYDIDFALPKEGVSLTLYTGDGTLIDSVDVPAMENGVWMRERGIVHEESPGYENTESGYQTYRDSLPATLVINEVLASNDSYCPNEGDYTDLIELYNQSDEPIMLSDYYLSDKKKELTRFALPADLLAPGEYYVVFASGKGGEEASFKVSAAGENLYLTRKGSGCIDVVRLPPQTTDISYGRSGSIYEYFQTPTIGEANDEGIPSVTSVPTASLPTGLYQKPLSLTLSGEGTIYYTLDGSEPTEESTVYQGETLSIDQTIALRMFATADGKLPSAVFTAQYLYDAEKYTLPILAIAISDRDIFGANGLYTKWESKSKEAPMNLMLIEEGEEAFSINCGLKIHGQGSRALPKKSFQVRFRSQYGASKLTYPLFEEVPTNNFDALILRSGSEDANRAFLRDEFMTSMTATAMPEVPVQAYKPVNLLINGEYFGIYYIRERLNADYGATHLGGEAQDIDMVKGWKITEHGDITDWLTLSRFCERNDLSKPENYQIVAEQICIENFIDYYIARSYTGDMDYCNIRFVRSRGGDNLWRIIYFDLDWGFRNNPASMYSLLCSTKKSTALDTVVITALLKNADFCDQFLTRLAMHLETTYDPERIWAHLDSMVEEISPDMPYNHERWGLSIDKWEEHLQFLKDYVWSDENNRAEDMKNSARRLFSLTDEEMIHYFGS